VEVHIVGETIRRSRFRSLRHFVTSIFTRFGQLSSSLGSRASSLGRSCCECVVAARQS
jgi:hypothetical protein